MTNNDFKNFMAAAPKFEGLMDPAVYTHWKQSVNTLASVYKLPDDLLLQALKLTFTENAGKWVINCNYKTSEELFTAMDAKYGNRSTMAINDNFRRLLNPPKTTSLFTQYVTHFDECFTALEGLVHEEPVKIRLFVYPLHKTLQDSIMSQNPLTLQQAISIGENVAPLVHGKILYEEDVSTTAATTPSPRLELFCRYCKKSGHVLNECRSLKTSQTQRNSHFHKKGRNGRSSKNFRNPYVNINDLPKN